MPVPEAGPGAPVGDGGAAAAQPGSADPIPPVCLSVAGAARGLGVATATLRSWERRYGIAPSMHTSGGHRRYSPEDLARLQVMHRLVREGVPPAQAARVAIQADVDSLAPVEGPFAAILGDAAHIDLPADVPTLDDVAHATDGAEWEQPAAGTAPAGPEGAPIVVGSADEPATPGGGRVLAMRGHSARARGLARAAIALDSVSCRRILATALAEAGALVAWEELVRPVLAAVGDRWEATGVGVEVEHSFSMVVTGVLAAHAASLSRPRNDRPVLLASVPGELHDLPLQALQAALADRGIRCHLIGARTPHDALVDAVVRLGPPVVFLWAQMPTTWHPELPALRPAPLVMLGGPGWPPMRARIPRPGDLEGAVAAVSAAMGL